MYDADKSISNVNKNTNYNVSGSDNNRPSRAPDDPEGFKKTVQRRRDDSKGSDDQSDQNDQAAIKKPHGLFDLTSPQAVGEQATQQPPASPFALMSTGAAKEMDTESAADLAGLPVKSGEQGDTKMGTTGFAQVRDDLSGLHQSNMDFSQIANLGEGTEVSAGTHSTLQTLIDQIVDKLYTVKNGGVTDTVMTIKNPPILAGSELVLTEYDIAKGEYNIAFTNLTQAGKALLDSQQANLLSALERQGYVTHIVITTTEPYRQITETNQAQQQHFGQRREDQPEEQKKQNRQQQREG